MLDPSFLQSLPDEERGIAEQLEAEMDIYATGSRFICPDFASAASDWDVYGHGTTDSVRQILGKPTYHGSAVDSAVTFRAGELNMILFGSQLEFNRFHAATIVCGQIGGPTRKPDRIKVFESFERGLRDDEVLECLATDYPWCPESWVPELEYA